MVSSSCCGGRRAHLRGTINRDVNAALQAFDS